jgi:hypothetical protein
MGRPGACACDRDNECPAHRFEILTTPTVASAIKTEDDGWLIGESVEELLAEAERLFGDEPVIEFAGDL